VPQNPAQAQAQARPVGGFGRRVAGS